MPQNNENLNTQENVPQQIVPQENAPQQNAPVIPDYADCQTTKLNPRWHE